MRKLIMLLLLAPSLGLAQAIVSTGVGGPWDQSTTWVGGVVPISTNSTSISIVGPVSVASAVYNSSTPLVIDQATVNTGGTLTIAAGAQVNVANAATDLILAGTGNMQVNGTLVQLAGAVITGTTAVNTSFNAGSTYEHRNTTWGTLLTASWNATSTILVTGLTGTTNAGVSWAQSIGNLTVNCPNLAAGNANLAGRLTNIAGDVNIVRTGTTGRLMFSNAVGVLNVAIGGDLNIGDGTQSAALWVTSTGTVTVTVAGSVTFSSTSATASQNATTGTGIIQVNNSNDFQVQLGTWNFVSGAGTGTIILNGGNFFASTGTQVNRSGAGNANINFIGAAANQAIDLDPSLTITGAINITVGKTSGNVNMQSPITLNSYTQTGGSFVQNGLALTINGAINQTGGNIDASTNTSFIIGSSAGAISAGLVFSPAPSLFSTFTMNRTGVTFSTSSAFQITTLNLTAGTLTHSGTLTMENTGIINVTAGILTNTPSALGVYDVVYANAGALNTGNELPTAPSAIMRNLSKSAAGVLTLTKNIEINGDLTLSAGTFANGANSITLDGNFISNGTSSTAVGATFTFTGASATLTGSIAPSFRNLVVNGGFTPSISYGVTANYTVGPSGVVSAGAGTVTFGGTTVITNNGTMNLNAVTIGNTFTMTAPAGILGIAGNFTSTGTFNNGGGTILFNGTTVLSATETYNDIQVTGAVSAANINQTIAGSMLNNGSFSLSNTTAAPANGNLTWSGSGTLSGSGSTTVADVNVTGTSFTYTATGSLTVNDDILGAGAFDSSSPTAGTVIFAGTGSAITAGGGTRTFRNLSVTGTLTPALTYTLAGAGGLDVSGTLVSGSTIIFGGTTQTITGSSLNIAFNTVTTNVGSTLTITPNITINGNLAGAGNIISNGTINFVGLTMSGTGTKNFNNVTVGAGTLNANADYFINGNLNITATGVLTFSAGNPTTTFSGNTTITITTGGTATFGFLTITGTLLSSAGTISVVRDFTNNGTFNHGGGTVSFSTTGTVQQQILGSSSTVFNNLVINNVGVATDVTNGLIASLSVDIAGALSFGEANAVFDADGSGSSVLRILSTGDNPAADGRVAALTFAGSSISGNVTVQRFMSVESGPSLTNGRIYRYISAPIANPSVTQLQDDFYVTGTFPGAQNGSTPGCTGCTTNASMFYYDPSLATPNFVDFPGGNLLPGVGYAAFIRNQLLTPTGGPAGAPVVIDYTGTINSGAIPIALNADNNLWNLVGNPYPSPITWNNAGAGSVNVAAGAAVRDNGSGGILVPLTVGAKIATGQSFWVQANAAGAATLTFNETDKTSIASTVFYREEGEINDQLSIKVVRADGKYDETFVRLKASTNANFDNEDIPKKNGPNDLNNNFIDLTSVSTDNVSLLLNHLPQIACGQPLNLNFEDQLENGTVDLTSSNFTISINPEGAMKSITWMLHDNVTNSDIDLSASPSYNFSISTGVGDVKNRFYLTPSSPVINLATPLAVVSNSCSGNPVSISVSGSQNGMTYGVELNGIYYPNVAQGNGSNIAISVEDEWLNNGSNSVLIKVNSGCDQQFLSTSLTVNKESSYTVNTTTSNATLCSAGSVKLQATSLQNDAQLKWYQTETSSAVLASGPDFNTPALSDSATYFVAAVSPGGCEGVRVPVKVAFENLSSAISAVPNEPVCRGESLTLAAISSLSGGSFKWYNAADATTPVGTNAELLVSFIKSSKNYYVSYVSAGGCESDRVAVLASVIPYATAITAQTQKLMICSGETHQLKANGAATESVYQWFDAPDGGNLLAEGSQYTTDALNTSTTYYVGVKSSLGCVSPRVAVEAKVDNIPAIPKFGPPAYGQICNNGQTSITITNPEPNIAKYRWYTSTTEQSSIQEGLQLTTESLDKNTSFYVSGVNASGCESAGRKEITVNVNQFVAPEIDGSISGQLKSNYATGNQWYLDNELLPGETDQIHVIASGAAGAYDLKVTSLQGCSDWAGTILVNAIITGLEDQPRELKIFPNPASEILKIYIEGNDKVQVQMLDQLGVKVGEVILSKNVKGWEGEVNVQSFSKGLYFITIFSETRSVTHKVIIK